MLQPILFYFGDTKALLNNGDQDKNLPSKGEKKWDKNGVVTHESVKGKVTDGDGDDQKAFMKQDLPSTSSMPMRWETHRRLCP
jgi:hypothetical protein